jgi:SMC interacting uncharacterized protein involved in chromosome segregation
MADDVDNITKTEVKLLIDNSLLEQEKRLSKDFRYELDAQTNKLISAVEKQNLLYSEQIINLNKDVTALNGVVDNLKGRISNIKAQMAIVGTACATLGGFVGFLIAQIAK